MKLDSAELARLDAMAAVPSPPLPLPGCANGPTTLAELLADRRARLARR